FPQQPIQNLLKSASESHNVWLRPITASLRNGNLLANFPGHEKWVNSVSITEDGKKAVSGASDNSLKLWDLQSGKIIHNWENDDWITAVAITPDGKKAISASRDKTLKLWNLQTGLEINTFKGHEDWVTTLAISPDGKKAISASRDKTLKLWNLDQGLEINTLIVDSPISSCTFSADGFTIIAKEESGRVHFFRLEVT
ncbi:MAG: WD40 repeat domain-containing protein, partial [Dolichospermum sp.]